MKKIVLVLGLVFGCLLSNGQTSITSGMTGLQTRTVLNSNFSTLYLRTTALRSDSLTPFLIRLGAGSGTISTGTYNIFIGQNTGRANTTGKYNVILGGDAGHEISTGWYNTFLGVNAGFNTTTANNNTFVGTYASYSNTDGADNTSVGYVAGNKNTTGVNNTLLGSYAGYTNTTGSHNVSIGDHSSSENIGSGNVIVGRDAGRSGTGYSYNVFLGTSAGKYETGSNKLFIDNASRTDEATSRTSALIYGVFSATVANQRLTINGKLIIPQISAALTDGTPTDTEIDTATGLTPATATAGFKVTILDNNGTGLLYLIESDGTSWQYVVMTKAVN